MVFRTNFLLRDRLYRTEDCGFPDPLNGELCVQEPSLSYPPLGR
jgi:hypothetical protein